MPASLTPIVFRITAVLLSASLLGACATGKDPRDPFEPFNRGVYQFNEGFDKVLLEPTARAYRRVLPQFVRTGVSNVYSNIGDVRVALNNALQGKLEPAVSDFSRIVINSSIGLLGLFDVASEAGIEKHYEDFGQTLGRWGVADGPYLMLPIFGPSTARDLVGFVVDYTTDPITYIDPSRPRNQLQVTGIVNRRAELLEAMTVLRTTLDPYEFLREAYLQGRRNLLYDGRAPLDKDALRPPPKPESEPAKPPRGVKK